MQAKHPQLADLRIAVILPCYNEEQAIVKVINEFQDALPEAVIYVFDNNSTDRTAEVARAAGANVAHVALKGKGNVVRRMFADVEADIYLMTDGDCTYDVSVVRSLVNKLLAENLDMVVGCRVDRGEAENYRRGHRFGNQLLTGSVRRIFGGQFTDMLSGYRVFSRRFVKSFPTMARGFEIETELTVHALELRMPCGEVETAYGSRPEESESKLSTYRDGFRILKTIGRLYMIERPLQFFSILSAILALVSVAIALPLLPEYLATGLVPRFPTAILATGLMISALLAFGCGLLLDNVTRGRQELKRLSYLSIPGVSHKD
ncbi:MAG: glycosyltransferase family 2 protein [Lysobacterales bacterium]